MTEIIESKKESAAIKQQGDSAQKEIMKEKKQKVFFEIDARKFKAIVAAMIVLIDEARFFFSPKGLEVVQMHPGRNAMVDLVLPADSFDKFESHDVIIGVRLHDIKHALKTAKKGDVLRFSLGNGENGELEGRYNLLITGDSSPEREFSLGILDLGGEDARRLKLPTSFKIEMLTASWQEAIKSVIDVSGYVIIEATEEKVIISADGISKTARVSISKEMFSVLDYQIEDPPVKACYAAKFIQDFSSAINANVGETVEIAFSTDKPISFNYQLADGGNIAFHAAPRLEY